MKHLLATIIAFLGLTAQAEILKVVYRGDDAVDVYIAGKPVLPDSLVKFVGTEITRIELAENPGLGASVSHSLMKNGTEILTLPFKESNAKSLGGNASFVINAGDDFIAMRDSDEIAGFRFGFITDLIRNSVKIKPIGTDGNDNFNVKSPTDTIRFQLSNPDKYTVKGVYLIDEDKHQLGFTDKVSDDGMILLPLNLKGSTEAIGKLKISFEEDPGNFIIFEDNKYNIDVYPEEIGVDEGPDFQWWWAIVGILAIFVLGCLYVCRSRLASVCKHFFSSRKQGNESTEIKTSEEYEAEIKAKDQIIKELTEQKDSLEKKLDNAPKQEDVEELKAKNKRLSEEKDELDRKIKNAPAQKDLDDQKAKNRKLSDEKADLERQLKDAKDELEKAPKPSEIAALNKEKKQLSATVNAQKNEIGLLQGELDIATGTIKTKEAQINQLNEDKDRLTNDLTAARAKCESLDKQLKGFSKQTHYIYLVDEALQHVSTMLHKAFKDVKDPTIRHKLVDPVTIGTEGLDNGGMESYMENWRTQVFDNPEKFFGTDPRLLSDEEVRNALRDNFIEELGMRDSFNKLARLYLLSNVGWINTQLVDAGFNVEAIQSLFAELMNLFNRFGVEISYPRLFVDKFDSNLHKDSMRCDIFNIFQPSDSVRNAVRSTDIIIDIVRVGLPKSTNAGRRMVMVSLPNF